jgi:polyisoprenoid-binding protein YceI
MMKALTHSSRLPAVIVVMGLFVPSNSAVAQTRDASMVEIRGSATFHSATSVPMISIHGKSTALEGRARIRQEDDTLVVEQLEAVVPIKTLSTGMGLRDEHMRKNVFTTADGTLPDMRFVADRVVCAGAAGATRVCQLSGQLTIRGSARPFGMALDVKSEGAEFRAVGDGIAKLSTYGIAAPSQLGVTTMDDVKLHVDFVVKRVEERVAQRIER